MPSYLKQRGGVWYFQRQIPPDVKDRVDAKLFREKSLKTGDRKQAEKAVRPYIVATDVAIDEARARLRAPCQLSLLSPGQRREVEAAGGVEDLEAETKDDVRQYNVLEAAIDMIANTSDEFLANRVAGHAQRLQRSADAAELEALAQIIREKSRILHRVGIVLDEVKRLDRAADPGLNEVVEHWARTTEPPEQTRRQFSYAVRRFCELNGDLPVKALTRAHLRAFADRLPELPANIPVAHLDLVYNDVVAFGRRNGWKTLSDATISKHLQGLRAIVGHAVAQGFLDSDPFEGFRFKKTRGRKSDAKADGRKPFSSGQLKALLSTLSIEKTPDEDDYWPPLISLCQGARLEEICQLDKSDVTEQSGIPCIRITDAVDECDGDTGKKLKNEASVRTVPIHPALIEMGFLEFGRKAKRRSSGPKLFGTFAPDRRGRYGGPYGKRFARLLREKAKITDPKVVFHSLRHTWTDAARNAGVPVEIRERLAGREPSQGSEKGYGVGFSVAVLLEHLAKIDPFALLKKPESRAEDGGTVSEVFL